MIRKRFLVTHYKLVRAVLFLLKDKINVTASSMTSDCKGNDEVRREHEEITASQTRQQDIIPATVSSIEDLSNSVKGLTLKVNSGRVTFKAGQWVDFFIPGVKTYTGYTMTSEPQRAVNNNELCLAIKYSDYPPTFWVHKNCKVGSDVNIRIGGDFYFPPIGFGHDCDLLLIGGGVGINPLASILKHCMTLQNKKTEGCVQRVTLLYSAKTEDELIFKDDFINFDENHDKFKCRFFVTRQDNIIDNDTIKCSRINANDLQSVISEMRLSKLLCYICGPSNMIDDMERLLLELNVTRSRILYEKWW